MKIRLLPLIAQLGVVAMVPLAAGCSDDDEDFLGPPEPVEGTWSATSVMVNQEDLVDNGMILNVTFDDSGIYVFHVVDDQLGLCGEVTECNLTGNWTATTTQITLDPGEEPTIIDYVTAGDTMTWTGTLPGDAATIVFERIQAD